MPQTRTRAATWAVTATIALMTSIAAPGDDAGEQGLRDGETVVEGVPDAYPFMGDRPNGGGVWAVRVVDDLTGQPIPGARVSVPFHATPGVPEAEAHMLAEGVADFEGWVRIPWSALDGWGSYAFADAPGYAVDVGCVPGGSEECRLRRGVDVPVVLVDLFGQPVPHARIAFNAACGHVPDQRSAMTDTEGRAVLRSIDPVWRTHQDDIWVDAPGVLRGTTHMRRMWCPGDPPVEIDVFPATSVAGRILGPDGTAVARALVGVAERSRPWVRTDDEGRFELVGVRHWETIAFRLPPVLGFESGSFTAPPTGTPRVVRLGAAETLRTVHVLASGPTGEPAVDVRLALVRRTDGYVVTKHADGEGRATLEVPEGSYRLLVDGELGTWSAAEDSVEVSGESTREVAVQVPRNPTVTVDASRVRHVHVVLATPTRFRVLELPKGDDARRWVVPIPREGPACFWVATRGWGERTVASIQVPAAGESVVLHEFPQSRLHAKLVGPDGKPVAGVLDVERPRMLGPEWPLDDGAEASATPTVQTPLIGTVWWWVQPVDPDLAWAWGHCQLPAGGGDFDLGDVQLGPRAAIDVRVDVPPGMEVELGASITCRVPGVEDSLSARLLPDGRADPNETKLWPQLGPGTVVQIERLGPLNGPTLLRVMEGPPPWRLVWPQQELEVEVRSAEPEHAPVEEAIILLDGDVLGPAWSGGRPSRFGGIPAGWHTLTVAAPGMRAKRYHLETKEQESRQLTVRLRAKGE